MDDDFEVGYACLFCGEAVDEEARDFCQLDFTTGAGFGTFVCHVGCLRERSHAPEHFPDIETPEDGAGERPEPALVEAWEDLVHVLAHVQDADLTDPAEVTALARAVEAAAAEHGVVIHHGHDEH